MNTLVLLFNALVLMATSRTKKYFINTSDGRQWIADFLKTVGTLLSADYSAAIVAHNGSAYDQSDYEMIGKINDLWKGSRVYSTDKDLCRRSNLLYASTIPKFWSNYDALHPIWVYKEDEIPKDVSILEGKVLSPDEVKIFVDKYNESQKDFTLNLRKLEGLKGVSYYALKGFISSLKGSNSISEGNVNGSLDAEVSICLNYTEIMKSAIIDEINEKAVESWLLSNG